MQGLRDFHGGYFGCFVDPCNDHVMVRRATTVVRWPKPRPPVVGMFVMLTVPREAHIGGTDRETGGAVEQGARSDLGRPGEAGDRRGSAGTA